MGLFDDLGGAVSDLFGSAGAAKAAKAYETASKIAKQNEQLTETSTKIQEAQQERQAFQIIGQQKSEVATSFNESGSALDLLRSSQQQSALAKGLIGIQGAVTAAGFSAQAAAYEGQAAAERKSSGGGLFGGLLKIFGAVSSVAGIF